MKKVKRKDKYKSHGYIYRSEEYKLRQEALAALEVAKKVNKGKPVKKLPMGFSHRKL